jgi:hypothetical protein
MYTRFLCVISRLSGKDRGQAVTLDELCIVALSALKLLLNNMEITLSITKAGQSPSLSRALHSLTFRCKIKLHHQSRKIVTICTSLRTPGGTEGVKSSTASE